MLSYGTNTRFSFPDQVPINSPSAEYICEAYLLIGFFSLYIDGIYPMPPFLTLTTITTATTTSTRNVNHAPKIIFLFIFLLGNEKMGFCLIIHLGTKIVKRKVRAKGLLKKIL
jgi:hypothetical protein